LENILREIPPEVVDEEAAGESVISGMKLSEDIRLLALALGLLLLFSLF